ncbi:MAG: shikimate dehydrogenase [Candidatus Margulisiibacteriota bacterium]
MIKHTSQNSDLLQLAVIGSPITHSKSPLIHQYFIDEFGINAVYQAIEIRNQTDLELFLKELRGGNWRGINITIPHKEHVIPFLDDVSEDVQIIGACNTIVNMNGQLSGYNTDAEGFYFPIQKMVNDSALILGNGGAAKAVIYQCAKIGMKSLTLVARNHDKSLALIKRIKSVFSIKIELLTFEQLSENTITYHPLIVNTTSVGMSSADVIFPEIQAIQSHQIYYDLIYNPWETAMMKVAKNKGAHVINGAMMLAAQGALAFNLFFNKYVDPNIMFKLISESTKEG